MNMLGQRTPSAGRSRPSSATHRVEGNIGFVKSAEVISPDVNKFLGTEACLGSAGAEQSRARNVTRSGSGLSSGKPFTRTGSGFSSGKLPMRNSGTTVANYDGAAVIKCDKVQERPLHRDSFRLIRSRYPKNNGELDLTRRPKISWLGQFLASNVFFICLGCLWLWLCLYACLHVCVCAHTHTYTCRQRACLCVQCLSAVCVCKCICVCTNTNTDVKSSSMNYSSRKHTSHVCVDIYNMIKNKMIYIVYAVLQKCSEYQNPNVTLLETVLEKGLPS